MIDISGVPFLFVDVGGQRSQRQKWFQCFESITSILFLASSSEFDQVLLEDRKTNRLQESCDIFETIINNKTFCSVSIILFLNKFDLLKEKIKHVSVKDYFPDFPGDPHNLEHVQNFLLTMFDEKRKDRSKPLFHHFTTAIDTDNVRFVFQAVKDTILQENLKSLMLQWGWLVTSVVKSGNQIKPIWIAWIGPGDTCQRQGYLRGSATVSKIHRGSQRGNLLLVASCGNSVMCKICEQYVSERERERFTEIYIFIYLVHDRRVYYWLCGLLSLWSWNFVERCGTLFQMCQMFITV